MVTLVPPLPRFATASETEVWNLLAARLPDDAALIANQRLSDEAKDHEADLVCLVPGAGVVVVEVKGSHVWVDDQGTWWIRRERDERIHPVDQARDATYALRTYVEADPRWGSRSRVVWTHHVVLAHTRLADDFTTPECPRWQISGSNDLGRLTPRIIGTAERRTSGRAPTADEVDLIREILTGRNLPGFSPAQAAEARLAYVDRLTAEQDMLLRVTRLLPRVEIRGGAGSGKTVLAIRQARDLAGGRYDDRRRVAVLCYSIGLASHLKKILLTGSRGKQPAFVGTYEDLAKSWGIATAGHDDSDFWERRLPGLMAERAAALPLEARFDAVVVDEAQDFAESWWTPIVAGLRDEETGGIYAYSDERQRVFARFGRPPLELVPLVLDHNLRNTRQIGTTFRTLAPASMELRGGDGPEVDFVACEVADALSVADDEIDRLLDEGWQPHDVALLTTGSRHPVHRERQEAGPNSYWADFWSDDDVFYGHVLGFKGLERRAVVLCVNEDATRERARERLYVGLSRATDRLVVVGDPAAIERASGGRDVLSRLQQR